MNMTTLTTINFCEPFLENLTDFIDENYVKPGKDLSRLAIVFGGKRPALFLKRHLAERIGTSFYPPQFFTIDEWMSGLVRRSEAFQPIQDLDNCFLLYTLAREVTPQILKGRETFAQFLPWTREILKFIEMLDLEQVEDSSLTNIQANAAIGYAVPEDINRLLRHIVALRQVYHKRLKTEKTYGRGLQYLRAAELVSEIPLEEFDQILFCNFFYLNRCEEAVIRDLHERKKATLIFQGDERRWPVLRRNAKIFGCPIQEADPSTLRQESWRIAQDVALKTKEKNGQGLRPPTPEFQLHLYSAFDLHSEVGLVREILKDISRREKTVIVLPEAGHLTPLLSEISERSENYNVSMGYPLRRSSLYSLLEFVFKAQGSRKDGRYYTKDYLKVLKHPFVKNLKLIEDPSAARILIHKIEEVLTGKERTKISGMLFIDLPEVAASDEICDLTLEMLKRLKVAVSRKDLQILLKQIHALLFGQWGALETFADFARVLEDFLDALTHKSFMSRYPLNMNIAERMYAIIDELKGASFREEAFPQEEIFRIFDSKVAGEAVSFKGSPLKGLQILGLFETRSLNFENVIVMDVNEGILPRLNLYEPLIPREVLVSLNLNRLETEEEIQRYQFMRLISSAKNVHLVYQENKEKEKSRFIEELIWEEEKKASTVAVTSARFEAKVEPPKKEIPKTPEIVAFLKNMTYSASSINTYLKDPMEFYTSYVLGLREKEDLLDEPEARHVGTFVHGLLEESFQPFLGKKPEISAGFRKTFARRFEQRFEETFGRGMTSDAFLLRSVLEERLNRFLDNEEFNEERQIEELVYLEHRFEETITLPAGPVKFKYIIDRIDRLKDGTMMVIDYKTGGLNQMPKPVRQIAGMEFSRESIRDAVRSFQIPLYFFYLDREFQGKPVNAALYNLRTLQLNKFLSGGPAEAPRDEIRSVFLEALDFVIREIWNPAVPFAA